MRACGESAWRRGPSASEGRSGNRLVDDGGTLPGSVCSRPFGITPRVPMMASGTIDRPASIARRELPALKRATWRSGLRVPSA